MQLFAAGLIGHYPDLDIGYGNISLRAGDAGQFLITGTQTGHLNSTNENHYSLVTAYDLERNRVTCSGPLQASSEAMTHASIYDLDPSIVAVVHVHSKALWDKFRMNCPQRLSISPTARRKWHWSFGACMKKRYSQHKALPSWAVMRKA